MKHDGPQCLHYFAMLGVASPSQTSEVDQQRGTGVAELLSLHLISGVKLRQKLDKIPEDAGRLRVQTSFWIFGGMAPGSNFGEHGKIHPNQSH